MTKKKRREVMYNPSVVSYSALSDFLRCPKYFEYIYIEKKERGIGQALTRGLKVHEMCEKLAKFDDPAQVRELMKGWPAEDVDRAIRYSEYFIDKHIPVITDSEGNQQNGIEFYDKIKIERGIQFEFHIDNIHYCKDGTLRIMDIKTGLIVPNRDQLYDDMQLQTYTWALLETIRGNGGVIPPRVQMGWWLWHFGYNLFVDYEFPENIKDRIAKLAREIKNAKTEKHFPRVANRFCPGCPMFSTCHPVEVDTTYKECKELAEFWKDKAEKKKAELLNKMQVIGTEVLMDKENNTSYYLIKKNFAAPDLDDLIDKVKGDIQKLKKYLKPTKEQLKEDGLIKDIKMVPIKTQVELHYKDIL